MGEKISEIIKRRREREAAELKELKKYYERVKAERRIFADAMAKTGIEDRALSVVMRLYSGDYCDGLTEAKVRENIADFMHKHTYCDVLKLRGVGKISLTKICKWCGVYPSEPMRKHSVMEKERILGELKHLSEYNVSVEETHGKADALLCEFLELLGHGDLVKVYDDIEKWVS